MIDIKNLTKSEILDLERQIQEYKKSEKSLTGYRVTFCVKFNSDFHRSDALSDKTSFGDYLANTIAEQIMHDLKMKLPEDVSGFLIDEVRQDQMKDWFE